MADRQILLFVISAGGRLESLVGRSRGFFFLVPSSSLAGLLLSSKSLTSSAFTVTRDFGLVGLGFTARASVASSSGSSLMIVCF